MSGARRPCPDCTHNVLITDDGQHLAHHYARPISAGGPCTGSGSPITATAQPLHVDGPRVMDGRDVMATTGKVGKFGCTGTAHGGGPCGGRPIRGTDRCKRCCGIPIEKQRAKGQLVLTAREFGFTDEIAERVDTADYMLRLAAGSFRQSKMYERLLADAYDAAERLRDAPAGSLPDDELPPHTETATDRERALYDLQRVFRDGGVSVLIGAKYAAAGKDGDLYQAEEGIRALVDLWNTERDRAFRFAKECRAAGLEERLVELEEAKAGLVADVFQRALADLDSLLRSGQLTSLAVSDPLVQRVLSERLAPLSIAGAVA